MIQGGCRSTGQHQRCQSRRAVEDAGPPERAVDVSPGAGIRAPTAAANANGNAMRDSGEIEEATLYRKVIEIDPKSEAILKLAEPTRYGTFDEAADATEVSSR